MESQSDYKNPDMTSLDFEKAGGLIPVVVQDVDTSKVLMLGYMNKEAYERTLQEGFVYFYSRSRKKLWKKGETSGNFLQVIEIKTDCDSDSLLVKVKPHGNVCHTGSYSCFNEPRQKPSFLYALQKVIRDRKEKMPEGSYTTSLFTKGVNKIAQKVGEEAVELIIEAKDDNRDLFLNETADLLYHLLVLITEKGYSLEEAEEVLRQRHPGVSMDNRQL
jgi:phosphoribosyl-ATP pyrophosphohydrolase/phosphoribosyl-AMP cyclohydrolase